MGKTWFGTNNLMYDSNVTFNASSEAAAYPAPNLGKARLRPGWRSEQHSLQFDGTNDHCSLAFNSDFNITNDLTIYVVFKSGLAQSGTLVRNHDSINTTGFSVSVSTSNLSFIVADGQNKETASTPISADMWYQAILHWNSTDGFKVWLNGSLVKAQNTQLSSIDHASKDIYVGSRAGISAFFMGFIQELAVGPISGISEWHTPWQNRNQYSGYWRLDNWEGLSIKDSSGNGNDLSISSLSSQDIVHSKGCSFLIPKLGNSHSFDTAVIDRRHNLATGSLVQWHVNNPENDSASRATVSTTVNIAMPIVLERSQLTNKYPWFEFIDSSAAGNGYYDIPAIYVGEKTELQRSLLTGYSKKRLRSGSRAASVSGSQNTYTTGDIHYGFDISFRCDAADRAVIEAAIDASSEGYPAVFCPDSERPEETYFVLIENPFDVQFKHITGDHFAVDLQLIEIV